MAALPPQAWAVLLLAPVIGSFAGVLIARLPQGRGVVAGRSACAACGTRLGVADLVPVVSFLALRGRCRHCGAAIPRRDLWVELAAIAVAALACTAADPALIPWGAGLGWALLALSGIDARAQILPDVLTLPLLFAGLAEAWVLEGDVLPERAAGAALGYLLFTAIAQTYRRLRGRDGLGQGDAKLLAAGGAWAGALALPYIMLLAAGFGLAYAALVALREGSFARDRRIPFGPCLACGIFLVWLWGAGGWW